MNAHTPINTAAAGKAKTQELEALRAWLAAAPDREAAACACVRLGMLALLFLRGPQAAAEAAYQLGDEMAQAVVPEGGES